MAPHSSTLAWKIPCMEEPGGLQSMGSLRVGHDWATSLSLFTFLHWRRKWQPTPVFLPGESQGRGAWWAAVYGVAQSRTRLKRLSSSSSSNRVQAQFTSCLEMADSLQDEIPLALPATLWETSIPVSTVAEPIYIPAISIPGFSFFSPHPHQHLLFVNFGNSHSDKYKVTPHFNLYFSD